MLLQEKLLQVQEAVKAELATLNQVGARQAVGAAG